MSIAPRHGSGPGQDGKSGRPSSSSMTFTTGPGLAPAGGRLDARPARRCAAGRRWRAPRARATSSPPSSTTPGRAVLDHDALHRRVDAHARARRLGRRAQRRRDRAHPAARVAPRPGRARPPRRGRGRSATKAVPGSSGPASVPISPWIANGTRTGSDGIPRSSSATEPSSSSGPDRVQPALAVGRLEHQRPGARRGRLPALGERARRRRRRPATSRARAASRVRARIGPGDHLAPVRERARTGTARAPSTCEPVRRPGRARR